MKEDNIDAVLSVYLLFIFYPIFQISFFRVCFLCKQQAFPTPAGLAVKESLYRCQFVEAFE